MHSINNLKYRIISLLMLVSLALGLGQVGTAQTATPEASKLLKELLDLPAPPPDSAFINGTSIEKYEQIWTDESPDPSKPPPDDAPTIDLIRYWVRWNPISEVQPSEQVRNRLFEAYLEQPNLLSQLVMLAPVNDYTLERCKSLYDKAKGDKPDEPWLYFLKEFLLYRSRYFLDELIELANKGDENARYKGENVQAVMALANLDWDTAEPMVMKMLNSGKDQAPQFALNLLYRHALEAKDAGNEEKYRKSLLEVVGNRSAPAFSRDSAIAGLSVPGWSGRDEWYLSLFQDESLLKSTEQQYSYSPLMSMYLQDPEKWRPILIKLLDSKDKIVRSNAAHCLLPFYGRSAKAETLKPLLPWLSDPDWAIGKGNQRLTLIQALDNLDLPESVPGLMWVIEHDKEALNRSRAASALARYSDPRAIPILRKALAEETDFSNRNGIVKGLLGSKGLTDEEQLAALESFVQASTGADGANVASEYMGRNMSIEQVIGNYLSSGVGVSVSVARLALNRADTLQKTNPKLSSALIATVHRWNGKHIDLDIVSRIADGTLPSPTLNTVLRRRERFRESVRPELEALAASKGATSAIAAVLLDDATLAQSVLDSKDETANIALLAAARLTKMKLPLSEVESFLNSKNSQLVLASERYLVAQDTTETRQMLWRNRPDQAFIAGWRENYGADTIEELESKLQKELLANESLVDVVALIANQHNSSVVRIYKDKVVLQVSTDRARYRERELSKLELHTIKESLDAVGFMELGAQLSYCHHGCPTTEILTLGRSKGRRVLMQPGAQNAVAEAFAQLTKDGKFKVSYHSKTNLPDLEVLYDGDMPFVRDVVLDGKVIKVQVERLFTPEEEAQNEADPGPKADSGSEEDFDYEKYVLWEKKRDATRFSWRTLNDGGLSEEVATPGSHFSPVALKSTEIAEFDASNWKISASPNSFVYATEELLIKGGPGQREVQLAKGAYYYPVITADGKWIVATKEEGSEEEVSPSFLVRINATTGREFRFDIPEADELKPMFFVPSRNQILVRRARQQWADNPTGPTAPEYYLVDPVTGKSQLIKGNFEPFEQIEKRFFQSSARPEEYWVALPNTQKDETQLGLYSFKDFSFRSVMTIPKIQFNSMNMWVDEGASKVYVAYEGELLRFSLGTKK
jgi:hypothetical protein